MMQNRNHYYCKIRALLLIIIVLTIGAANTAYAYESEDKIKAVLIGKLAKYIKWEDKKKSSSFIITILNNPYNDLFDKIYNNKKIHGKAVQIRYLDDIDALEDSDVLYISDRDTESLSQILALTSDKNILTISDMRGFAERKGVVQIYFTSQKAKLKINVDAAKEQNLKIKSSLLNIADIVKESDE